MHHFKILYLICCVTIIDAVVLDLKRNTIKIRVRRATSDNLYDVEGFLNSYGYPFENHEVETEDGYILTLHRVPYGRNDSGSTANVTRPPVLVMHGILCSSINFMFMGPENSIIPMLADAGYDVWAGNNRGNTWSRKHVSLDPDSDDEFWNFSFHEMGYYDDTAMIDYILNNTENEKLFYVGHSQGTSQFFAMASSRPEYNEKIILMSALAPVVHCNHLTHPLLRILSSNYAVFDTVTKLLNVQEIFAHSEAISQFCQQSTISTEVCIIALFVLMGFDSPGISRDVDRLAEELLNLQRKYLIGDELFTHGDYMYANDLDTKLNNDVISFMDETTTN